MSRVLAQYRLAGCTRRTTLQGSLGGSGWHTDGFSGGSRGMSGFRGVSRGLSWTLTAQLIMSAGQLFYAALTARIFTPAEYGGFAAGISLMGILSLLTTTGLPSFVLKEFELGKVAIRKIRLIGLLGGAVSAALFVLLLPFWLSILRAPEGHTYLELLVVGQAIGPSAAIESALLRRELRPKRDAAALIVSFVLAYGCGIFLALMIGQGWTLAVAIALQAILMVILSRLMQTEKPARGDVLRFREIGQFTRNITLQNTSFFLLQRLPEWVMSASLGSAALGQYARGASLAQMPATALNAALNRAMQPYWRLVTRATVADQAMTDAATLSAGMAFPVFGILAANGGALIDLWLGAGWEPAGSLATLLAIGAGFAVPFGGLVSSQEMRGNFRPVQIAQWGMGTSLAVPLILLFLTQEIWWAAAAVSISSFVGLFAMALVSVSGGAGFRDRLRSPLVRCLGSLAMWATGVAVVGLFAGLQAAKLVSGEGRVAEAVVQLGVAGIASTLTWLLTFRWHETNRVLRRRGVRLPVLIGGRSGSV